MSFEVQVGDRLRDRFEVLEVLADSDIERVARCWDVELDREVLLEATGDALEAIPTADGMGRAMREARLLAGLNGAGIPRVLDVLKGTTGPILVMESYSGESLASRLERTGPLPPEEVRSLLLDLARTLATVHAGKVVHRDVSSRHVILGADGSALLRGFRFAKQAGRAVGHSSFWAKRVQSEASKASGEALPEHAAPEQHGGTASNAATDIFALGCVTYAAAVGEPAFLDGTGKYWRQPMPLRRAAPGLDSTTSELIEQCLSRSPALRPANAQAIVDRLSGRGGGAWKRRGTGMIAVALGALLIGGLGAAWALRGDTGSPGGGPLDRGGGFESEYSPSKARFESMFRRSRALVVGISNYPNLPKLTNAASDAAEVAEVLEELGWDVVKLLDEEATEKGILQAFDRLIKDVDKEDRLLFYYAGHGARSGSRSDVGYLQPIDADPDDSSSWVSFERLKDLRSSKNAKHSLALLDCCYGGAATFNGPGEERRSGNMPVETWTRNEAWVVMTSGLATETVEDEWFRESERLEHSPFAHLLLKELRKKEGPLAARSLMHHVRSGYHELGVTETPTYFSKPDQTKGDFVFFRGSE